MEGSRYSTRMILNVAVVLLLTYKYGKEWMFYRLLLDLVIADDKQTVEMHMEKGNAFLSKGQFADALHHYHSAVELDPNNYQIYFRRATVLLATGKVNAALPDLDRVVELKPDFIAVSAFRIICIF
jgi:tetratricopeptide (TPR) repeat protein